MPRSWPPILAAIHLASFIGTPARAAQVSNGARIGGVSLAGPSAPISLAPGLASPGADALPAPEAPIIVVHLRRPRANDPEDGRDDPFWEFGSFGVTGCHGRNLLHPARAEEIEGARLAFAQGGDAGHRLVYLTPPISAHAVGGLVEARWQPNGMPFRYEEAPLLMDAAGNTDFPFLKSVLRGVERGAWTSRFSSKFRTRREPLDAEDGRALAELFDGRYAAASGVMLAAAYVEALPHLPGRVERDRRGRLQRLRSRAESAPTHPATLEEYVQASPALPKSLNVLALREYQRKAGLPRFSKLDARFIASFKLVYGPKGSDRLAQSLGSPIERTLGTGWMGRVVSLKDGRTVKTIIREGSRTSKIGILFETEAWLTYHLRENEARYGIKVLPILAVGVDGMYLEKPFIDHRRIASAILKAKKKLSPPQLRRLKALHRNAIRLAEETGIPLDLKAGNMFWDGSDWVLLDPIGSISLPRAYSKTLDARDFDVFYARWSGKKKLLDGLTIDRVVARFPRIREEYARTGR